MRTPVKSVLFYLFIDSPQIGYSLPVFTKVIYWDLKHGIRLAQYPFMRFVLIAAIFTQARISAFISTPVICENRCWLNLNAFFFGSLVVSLLFFYSNLSISFLSPPYRSWFCRTFAFLCLWHIPHFPSSHFPPPFNKGYLQATCCLQVACLILAGYSHLDIHIMFLTNSQFQFNSWQCVRPFTSLSFVFTPVYFNVLFLMSRFP